MLSFIKPDRDESPGKYRREGDELGRMMQEHYARGGRRSGGPSLFDESKIERDSDGQFASKGGASIADEPFALGQAKSGKSKGSHEAQGSLFDTDLHGAEARDLPGQTIFLDRKEPHEMTRGEYSGAYPMPSGGAGVKLSGQLKDGDISLDHIRLMNRLPLDHGDVGFEGTTALRELASNGLAKKVESRDGPKVSVSWELTDKGKEAAKAQTFTETEALEKWQSHESLVRDAIKSGKTVPPEVLAEYPDEKKTKRYSADGSGIDKSDSPTAELSRRFQEEFKGRGL